MRDVDTSALRSVAPSLGVGNPATAVLPVSFDDDNLQQVLDVGKFLNLRAVDGVFTMQHAGGASAIVRSSRTLEDLFVDTVEADYWDDLVEKGLTDFAQVDVWITWVQVLAETANTANIDALVVGTNRPGSLNSLPLYQGIQEQQGALPLLATDLYVTMQDLLLEERPDYPLRLPRDPANDALLIATENNATGDCNVLAQFGLHFQLRGTPLWYEV